MAANELNIIPQPPHRSPIPKMVNNVIAIILQMYNSTISPEFSKSYRGSGCTLPNRISFKASFFACDILLTILCASSKVISLISTFSRRIFSLYKSWLHSMVLIALHCFMLKQIFIIIEFEICIGNLVVEVSECSAFVRL